MLDAFKEYGEMAERFKAAVLKTAAGESLPWVRIPLSPPVKNGYPSEMTTLSKFVYVLTYEGHSSASRGSDRHIPFTNLMAKVSCAFLSVIEEWFLGKKR